MLAVRQWLQQLQFGSILEMIVIVASSLLCITVHETCHGVAAYWMGDDTAKRQGRLSLNPLRHVDLVGLLMMAVARFGWARPVPVDMRRFKRPRLGMALTAVAGPMSNVLLVLAAAVLRLVVLVLYYRTQMSALEYVIMFFEYTVVLSAGLAVFNLLPVPPLDGSKVLFALLSDRAYHKLMQFERWGMLLLIILIFTDVLNVPLVYMRDLLIEFANAVTLPIANILQRLI